MRLVKVRGQLTLESIDVKIQLYGADITALSRQEVLPDEAEYYAEIEEAMDKRDRELTEDYTTRQFIVQNTECISSIHVLRGRGTENCMYVYMRSSDVKRLPSDLGFLCRMATKYSLPEVRVVIGSHHIVL